MTLTDGVAASCEGCGLFVVHRHTGEGFTYLLCGSQRIRLAVNTFRVHIDQTHLDSRQRVFHGLWLVHVAVAFVRRCQPLFFVTPVDIFFGFPNIDAAEREAVSR